jgi:hypothetical protein
MADRDHSGVAPTCATTTHHPILARLPRHLLAELAEAIIAELDARDGDCDLEPEEDDDRANDCEPDEEDVRFNHAVKTEWFPLDVGVFNPFASRQGDRRHAA